MGQPTLRRFDLTVYDASNNPVPGARIDFFFQGATLLASGTIPSGNSQIGVLSTGALLAGSTLQVGVNGPTLTVASVDTPNKITVTNSTGNTISVTAGTRLIVLSRSTGTPRPTVYSDARGTTPVSGNCYITADATYASAVAYLADSFLDYIIAGSVTVDAVTTKTDGGTIASTSWQHVTSGTDRLLVVAVSFQENTGTDQITSVTYDGVALTQLAAGNLCELWYLKNPNTGAKNVVVTWDSNGNEGVAAASMTFNNVHQTNSLGAGVVASGNSTSPSVLPWGQAGGFVIGMLGLDSNTGVVTITTTSGQTQRWNLSAGAGPLTNVQTAGSTEAGSSAFESTSWTLSAARNWGAIGTDVKPSLLELHIDGQWASAPIPAFVDVRDFPSIQAAINAIPVAGGTVYIPAGTWNLSDQLTLPADRAIRLLGDGKYATILNWNGTIPTEGNPVGHIRVSGPFSTIADLQIKTISANKDIDLIRLESGGFNLHDCLLYGPGQAGAGGGIRDLGKTSGGATRGIAGHSFRRSDISATASWGIELVSTDVVSYTGGIWDIELEKITLYDAKSGGSFKAGMYDESCVHITCKTCQFNGPAYGTYPVAPDPNPDQVTRGCVHIVNASNVVFYNCTFQPPDFYTALSVDRGHCIRVLDTHFESGIPEGSTDQLQWWLTTAGLVTKFAIEACTMNCNNHQAGPRLLKTGAAATSAFLDGVFRDSLFLHNHNEGTPTPTDDVVLGTANDGIQLVNTRMMDYDNGATREIAYTDRAGCGLVLGQADKWQFRIPGVSGTSVVARPTDGTMIWDATAHKLMVYENGTWKTVQTAAGLQLLAKTADQSSTSTTGADISDLTVALAANEVIHFHAYLVASSSAGTGTGIQTAINGPTTDANTKIDATIVGWTGATSLSTVGINAYESYQANTASAGTTRRVFEIYGRVINGANAGTFALRLKSETNGSSVTVHRGSWLQYFKGTN